MTFAGKEHVARSLRSTERQSALALKQQELGTLVEEVCRKLGIAQAQFFRWRSRFAGLGPSELGPLSQFEEANTTLMELVAGLSLDTIMLQDDMRRETRGAPADANW